MKFATQVAVVFLTVSASFGAFAQIVNGGFENADAPNTVPLGWTRSTTNAFDPNSEADTYTGTSYSDVPSVVPAPSEGSQALGIHNGIAAVVMVWQDFAVPAAGGTLSFDIGGNNEAATGWVDDGTLNLSGNQLIRVDLLDPAAIGFTPDSTAIGLLQNLFVITSEPDSGTPFGFTTVATDISAFAGQTVRVRFAVAGNNFFLAATVDDVNFVANAGLPAATYWTLAGLVALMSLTGALYIRRRRNRLT